MSHWLLLLLLALASVALIVLAWQLGRSAQWLLAWLRGCAICISLMLALLSMLLAYDLTGYQAVTASEQLATISVKASGQSDYLLEFTATDGASWYTTLSGDAWQLQVRGLLFKGPIRALARSPAARIHAVSSRYYDFANRHQARSVVVDPGFIDGLFSRIGLDLWGLQRRVFVLFSVLGIDYEEQGSAVVPLINESVYFARWERSYVAIEPANEVARISLAEGQAVSTGDQAAAAPE
ncbi:MAG: hypothetical protein HKO07_08975 [Pseudomonadales bacterium]|nr:hypothetical protein [Pseudomonadales bacterium]NNL56213.1 hypothetical protein [Pseudomonadales bacterium]